MLERLKGVAEAHPYPLLFATISGAHLYGFPSADSDYDLRGAHILPLAEVVGLRTARDTIESTRLVDGVEVDLVTHDVAKFLRLIARPNGYVLEQLFSPLVVTTTPEHAELCRIARDCITRHHGHHYLGFSRTQWQLFEKSRRVKPLLYVYRVLLTGIHLMRTGIVEADLTRLNGVFRLAYIVDLIRKKTAGAEKGEIGGVDLAFHEAEYRRLTAELESARDASTLPEKPRRFDELSDFLVHIRMNGAR